MLKAQSMKYGLAWKGEEERVVLEMFTGQSVTESKFLESFGTGKREGERREDVEEENLLAGIQDYSSVIPMPRPKSTVSAVAPPPASSVAPAAPQF